MEPGRFLTWYHHVLFRGLGALTRASCNLHYSLSASSTETPFATPSSLSQHSPRTFTSLRSSFPPIPTWGEREILRLAVPGHRYAHQARHPVPQPPAPGKAYHQTRSSPNVWLGPTPARSASTTRPPLAAISPGRATPSPMKT